MRTFKRIAVYCASSDAIEPQFRAAAREVGQLLASRGIGLVYGGGRVGLMGEVANAALAAGGEVLGVIPQRLFGLELGHTGLTDLFVVDSMHARKAMMANLADAFIALPGGFGTWEELFEVLTLGLLNYHDKPVGLLNTAGFYNDLVSFTDQATRQGFIRTAHRALLHVKPDPAALLEAFATAETPDFAAVRGLRE